MQTMKYFDSQKLRNTLNKIALFIATYESLSDFVIKNVQFFYCRGVINKKLILQDYTDKVLHKYKKEGKTDHLYSCLYWFLDNDVISQQDLEFILDMRNLRNKFVHEMSDYVLNGIPKELNYWHNDLLKIYKKISTWWIKNIEIEINDDITKGTDAKDITGIMNPMLVFLDLLTSICNETK